MHRSSLPTVVSPRIMCLMPVNLQPLWVNQQSHRHDRTNLPSFVFDPVVVVAPVHILCAVLFLCHTATLQMLKTSNLSSTLTTPTTPRTISTALAELLVAKRQAQPIPSSHQTT